MVLGEDREVPVTGIQKAMVKSMKAALAVPHFVYGDEVTMCELVKVRLCQPCIHLDKLCAA